jgi:hypothetical protein
MKKLAATLDLRGFRWRGSAWERALSARRDVAYGRLALAQRSLLEQHQGLERLVAAHRHHAATVDAAPLAGRATALTYLTHLRCEAAAAEALTLECAGRVARAREECLQAERKLACARKLHQTAASAYASAGLRRAEREADLAWLVLRGGRA